MGGSTTSAPDYTGAAQQQGASSQQLAAQQTAANRPNQNTPWGSSSWQSSLGTDPATGAPITQWTQNQTLDPTLQNALTSQIGLIGNKSNLASSQMGNVAGAMSQPFNWNALPSAASTPGTQQTQGTQVQGGINLPGQNTAMPTQTTGTTNEPAFSAQRDSIANAMFSRMMPLQQMETNASNTRMANMGLPMGSEAYNREANRLQTAHQGAQYDALMNAGTEQQRMQQALLAQQQQAYGQQSAGVQQQNAALQNVYGQNMGAGQFANSASGQQFGQNLAANAQNFGQNMGAANYQNQLRQTALGEQQTARQMPLNEMNALLGGTQINPAAMPTFAGAGTATAPNYLSAAQSQGQQYANQQPDWGTLLGTGLSAWLGK